MSLVISFKKSEKWDFLFIAISALVALLHIALAAAVFRQSEEIVPKIHKNLLVSTVSLKQELKTDKIKEAEAVKEVLPKKEVKKEKTEVVKKAPSKKTAVAKTLEKPNPKNNPVQKKKELLSQAKKNLEKIGSHEKKPSAQPEPQSKRLIGELNAEKTVLSDSSITLSYKDEVAMILKEKLKLPESGTVEIKLGLKKSGEVERVDILSSKSELNSAFVRSALFKIPFPPSKNDPKNVVLLFTLTSEHG